MELNRFRHLLESSIGNVKPLVTEEEDQNPATPTNYRNGTFRMWEAKNVNFTSWTVFDWFLYGSSWNIVGNVSSIMIYNRPLSSAESAQNFEAIRGRYGI